MAKPVPCYGKTDRVPCWQTWLATTLKTVAAGSGTARAMDYTLKRWPALERYADSGTHPIDNNAAENGIHPVAIGRKNCLYLGSERADLRLPPK